LFIAVFDSSGEMGMQRNAEFFFLRHAGALASILVLPSTTQGQVEGGAPGYPVTIDYGL
jgi:hypothetical protein